MLTTLKNAMKVKEIRQKLLFTFLMMIVIRLGCQLPVPGVDREYFSNWFAQQTGDSFNFLDAELQMLDALVCSLHKCLQA